MTEKKIGNSIFSFEQEAGIDSKMGNWENETTKKEKELNIQRIEGPFDDGKPLKYISRTHEYTYQVIFNRNISKDDAKSIKWAVSYDESDANEAFYLFSRGRIEGHKLSVNIQISKGNNSFKIYAYRSSIPNKEYSLQVLYKKVITLFIGGAGDKEAYYGNPPTNIIKDLVKNPFDNYLAPKKDYTSFYFGYNEVSGNTEIKNIISKLSNKEGIAVNIIGHSLGGWNGAHLSQKLTDKGYNVDLLITLDPVGTGKLVSTISNIPYDNPKAKAKYWINIYANAKQTNIDDYVADAGGQWIPSKKVVSISEEVNLNHGDAGGMFKHVLNDTKISSSDFLLHFINLYLNSK